MAISRGADIIIYTISLSLSHKTGKFRSPRISHLYILFARIFIIIFSPPKIPYAMFAVDGDSREHYDNARTRVLFRFNRTLKIAVYQTGRQTHVDVSARYKIFSIATRDKSHGVVIVV